eukprot:5820685-Prorocentrum_lima.AAC.1
MCQVASHQLSAVAKAIMYFLESNLDPSFLGRRCVLLRSNFNWWLLSTNPHPTTDLRSSFAGVS